MAVGCPHCLVLLINFHVVSALQQVKEKSVRLRSFQVVVNTGDVG